MSILEGIKVIDLASFLAGPGAATLMADQGAEVIKIEPKEGDAYRRLHGLHRTDYNWQLTSRHKKGISLDISHADGREALERLLSQADVLVMNFREEQRAKYGLTHEPLLAAHPRLVCAQFTGFGTVGPERHRRGYDVTTWWARSGILRMMHSAGEAPAFPTGGVGDHASAMALFSAVMLALYRREKTGKGGLVETSLIANGCWANGMHLQGAIAGFDLPKVLEEKKMERTPFAQVYETRDGRYIVLALTHPLKELPDFAKALARPAWLEDPRFKDMKTIMGHRKEIRLLFQEAIGQLDFPALAKSLDKYNLTYGLVEGLTEVVNDAHLIEAGVIVRTESKDPDYQWTVNSPLKIHGEPTRPINDPPRQGEHTREILAAHGYTPAEIDNLIAKGAAFAAENQNQRQPA